MWLCAMASAAMILMLRRSSAPRLAALGRAEVARGFSRSQLLVASVLAGTGLGALRPPAALDGLAMVAALGLLATRRRRAAARDARARRVAGIELSFALAAELRAGRAGAEALRLVADVAGPFQPALAEAEQAARRGDSPGAALLAATGDAAAVSMLPVAVAWHAVEQAGGQVAAVLDRVGESLTAAQESRDELDAALAGPRSTATVLALLPVAGILLAQSVGAEPLTLLLHRRVGWALLAVAVGADALGVWLMQRIARFATP